jgi:hypothetical protein
MALVPPLQVGRLPLLPGQVQAEHVHVVLEVAPEVEPPDLHIAETRNAEGLTMPYRDGDKKANEELSANPCWGHGPSPPQRAGRPRTYRVGRLSAITEGKSRPSSARTRAPGLIHILSFQLVTPT